MKKFCYMILVLVMLASLVACGRKNNNDATVTTVPNNSTTAPSTGMPTLPDSMPTLETNIPDPSVDTQMPDGGDITDLPDSTERSRHIT